ncbi:threonine transporter RhtB [Burkholderia mayonis]|uniref:Threonine transporter RhtB n=1 Tax=Burkholderia mayonis TaxID=1385591 RepID=A0A1B4FRN7_9BURK|nr:threonine transporter RhtB [Burkholderia mayonis]KVE51728.1 threonine transporter RhtB [Burkholderia mayonis]
MVNQVDLVSDMLRSLLTLLLAAVVVMGSPGPSTVSATAMGASYGVRRSLRYAWGLIAGTVAVLLLVSTGVTAFVMSMPNGTRVLNVISAIYILYLAYKIATAPPLDARAGRVSSPAFKGGFLLAVANPKAYIAIGAVFAGTTLVASNYSLDAAAKIVLLSVMIIIIHLGWLLAGVSLSRFLHDPVASRIINVSLAAILAIVSMIALFE